MGFSRIIGFITISITLIVPVCVYASYNLVRGYLVRDLMISGLTENGQIVQQQEIKQLEKLQINEQLPKGVIDGVKYFVFFLGHARSGHSIVGSLLDAHPHIVIAHEANVVCNLGNGILEPNKTTVFNKIWKKTVNGLVHGKRVYSGKGYSLLVEGLYEGKYVDHIEVIGDKKAGTTTSMLMKQPEEFSKSLKTLKSFATVKMIHVIRNPYDNIATSVMYASFTSTKKIASFKKSKDVLQVNKTKIYNQVKRYFAAYEAIENAKKSYKLDYIEVHGRDLVSDARETISRMCNGLGVFCSDSYLDVCSDKVFKTESKTRYKIHWDKEHIDEIQRNIDRFSSLNGYTFDS